MLSISVVNLGTVYWKE